MIEKPLIFRTKNKIPRGALRIDIFSKALQELFSVLNPRVKKDDPAFANKLSSFVKKTKAKGIWIYYHWKHLAIYAPEEDVYFRLRTARNRNLITPKEQRNYRACVVGIAGLSVGSSALSALVMCGGPKTIKLADPDTIDITNLNRIRAKLFDVGKHKVDIAAREVWELDPFVNLRMYPEGLTEDTIQEFMAGKPKLNIFIDEMDNVALKIKARLLCRDLRIPVLMATDNGDGIILDVERFDLEPRRPIFHGRVAEEYSGSSLSAREAIRTAITIIDPAYFTERQQDSILHIGTTLSGVAQIGTAATIAGAAVAYVVRRIANKDDLPSGRYTIRFEEIFDKNYHTPKHKKRRAALTKKFKRIFDL